MPHVTDRCTLIRFAERALLGASFAALSACTARVGTEGYPPPATLPGASSSPVLGGDPPGIPATSAPIPSGFVPAPSRLRRLTAAQYRNSLLDLLGPTSPTPMTLEPDISLSGFVSIGASQQSLSARATEDFESVAMASAQAVMADPVWRSQNVPCADVGPQDEACTQTFLRNMGERIWRRQLSDVEVARWAAISSGAAATSGSFWLGLAWGLSGLLQSPNFLYRAELGSAAGAPSSTWRLNDYEVASRLSYLLWNSTPDDELLGAARAGQLGVAGGLQAQAGRLLASPRAQRGLAEYWFERLQLGSLASVVHPPATFPAFTASMPQSMALETELMINDLVFTRGADIREFFDSRTTFVNQDLANLYGLPGDGSATLAQVALPEGSPRIGYLGHASFLALNAHQETTSPTRRGKFVREILLCQSIPAPPPNTDLSLDEGPATAGLPLRARLEKHRSDPTCAGCHALLDPIGLGFESFDAIGALRTQDGSQPIDPSGELDGLPFKDARELALLLKQRPEALDCLARSFYRYAVGRVENGGESVAVEAIKAGLVNGNFAFLELVRALVFDPSFTMTAPPAQ